MNILTQEREFEIANLHFTRNYIKKTCEQTLHIKGPNDSKKKWNLGPKAGS